MKEDGFIRETASNSGLDEQTVRRIKNFKRRIKANYTQQLKTLKMKKELERQIRDIISQHIGGTYENKQKCVEEICLLFNKHDVIDLEGMDMFIEEGKKFEREHQGLFNLMRNEHGLILLESELDEIVVEVEKIKKKPTTKTFILAEIKDLIHQYDNEEITMSRMVEILNEKANKNPWLSPFKEEREKQEEQLLEIFPCYPNGAPKWQYMNGLIRLVLDNERYTDEDLLRLGLEMYPQKMRFFNFDVNEPLRKSWIDGVKYGLNLKK